MNTVNSNSLAFDQTFKSRTVLESWVKKEDIDDKDFVDQAGNLQIGLDRPKMFTVGAIFDKPEEVQEDRQYHFYLYKVAVGKAYCYNRKKDEPYSNIRLPAGYDSVFLENESQGKARYLIS